MENEKRLIDANALLEKLSEICKEHFCFRSYQYVREFVGDVADSIREAPTVDAVALPCKLGDTVYFPVEDYHDSAIIDGISITEQGMFFNWVQYEFGVDITECWDDGQFDVDEIGKTVFLTREEAEQALAKMDGGNEDGWNEV